MIKKKHYYNTQSSAEYYIYYTVNDGYPVIVDTSDWPEVIRNEIVSGNDGRLVFNTAPTYIPQDAFYQTSQGISNLVSITLPDTITSIGNLAFGYCDSLTSFTLPDSVTTISGNPFIGTGISTPVYNSTIFALLPSSYSGSSYTIPNGITTIVGSAAEYCDSLTSLVIPDSVTEIGTYAFFSCDHLTQIEIGSGVTSIGDHAFLNVASQGSFLCKAVTPPSIDGMLGRLGVGGWTLYVPAASVSAYSAETKWASEFASIQAIQN